MLNASRLSGADPVASAPPDPAASGLRRIRVRLDPQRLWRWQLWLLDALAARPGVTVEVEAVPGRPYPAALRLLLALERPIFRIRGEQAADLLDPAILAGAWPGPQGVPDRTIDLAGAPGDGVLAPLYDGEAGDEALIGAIMEGRALGLSFAGASAALGSELRPAIESRTVLTRALNRVFSTVLSLCLAEAARSPATAGGVAAPARPVGIGAVAAFAAGTLARKAGDRLTALCTRAPRWRVGWRHLAREEDFLGHTRRLPETGYAVLPEDGRRYYADPFPFSAEGRRWLFVEEYCYARQKGLISAAEVAEGRVGPMRPVLEEPHHLSYPFVFAHDGAVFMIPESSVCGRVELYRARRLPDAWERVAVLLDGIAASDVTLTRAGGLWWMFAGTHPHQASVRDTLSLFHAPDLLGPWTPHPLNPVVVDLRQARPGGHVFASGGALWRPVQDATEGYGSALGLCRVDEMTPHAYRQTLAATIRPGPAWAKQGLHTLNRDGLFEAVDGMF
ncbi:glucosamine inositolphosphorylceramide transferase family protein [Methylobacterium oryzisoli]|uniref:glucosamine inositolphosphorylceramide transferase family protein n=1 Tax=Methylobacterium oryzisoli TaxID=3385502 RepID=UPI0038923B27